MNRIIQDKDGNYYEIVTSDDDSEVFSDEDAFELETSENRVSFIKNLQKDKERIMH